MARPRFTLLTMMKDEGASLLEWVAYHRRIGADNICVYTNDCSDGTDAMLDRLQEMGLVHHFANEVPEGKKPQPNALSLAQKNPQVTDSDWIITLDADEFLNIKTGDGSLDALVAACPADTQAIALTWRIMGSGGETVDRDGLVTETYTKGAPDDFRKGWGVKTLFRPFENMKLGIHRPSVRQPRRNPDLVEAMEDQLWVNGSGQPVTRHFKRSSWRSSAPTLGYDLAEVAHFAVQSAEAFLLRRLRGNVNNKAGKYDPTYFAIFDRNEEEHAGLARHAPDLRADIATLLEDDKLAALQAKALAYRHAALDHIRASPEYPEHMAALAKAGAVPYARLDDLLFTQPLPPPSKDIVRKLKAAGHPDHQIARLVARSLRELEAERDALDAEELAQGGSV